MDSSSTESLIGQYSGRPSQLLLSRSRSLSRQPNTPRHIPTPPGWLNSYIRAELAIKLEASRLLILHAARVLDRGEEAKKEGRWLSCTRRKLPSRWRTSLCRGVQGNG